MMDRTEHTAMRKLVKKVFTPRAIAALEPMIRAKITAVAKSSATDTSSGRAVGDYSESSFGVRTPRSSGDLP